MGLRGEIIMGFSPEVKFAQYLLLYQKVMAKAPVCRQARVYLL